jgi:BirA family biotin operon repressor/biotin-[acetyl-CoA-carboxylase] ligase
VLLVAETQTAGRGRLGRPWHGEVGHALTFSVGLMLQPADWSGLSLAVGLALADALDPDGQWGLRLKWPNDLCWLSAGTVRKLGGILIETQMGAANAETPARRWCVVGVGLNLRTPDIQSPGLAPVGWSEVTGEAAPHGPDILQACTAALVPALRAFELHGFAPLAERFAKRDALLGQAVVLSDGRQGTAMGVDAQGALKVQTAQGLQAVHSAEVSVRPSNHQDATHV